MVDKNYKIYFARDSTHSAILHVKNFRNAHHNAVAGSCKLSLIAAVLNTFSSKE